jgi:hypothetical protein
VRRVSARVRANLLLVTSPCTPTKMTVTRGLSTGDKERISKAGAPSESERSITTSSSA